MPIEFQLMYLVTVIFFVIIYFAAGIIYDFYYRLKANDNPLSKIIGAEVKDLDKKAEWIKRYRLKIIFILALIASIPLLV